MRDRDASRIAEFMALLRALESVAPVERRLFPDDVAHGFLRPSLRRLVWMARVRPLVPLITHVLAWRPVASASGSCCRHLACLAR
jgi:hypothetical protein